MEYFGNTSFVEMKGSKLINYLTNIMLTWPRFYSIGWGKWAVREIACTACNKDPVLVWYGIDLFFNTNWYSLKKLKIGTSLVLVFSN
jgi:hypothetical protein